MTELSQYSLDLVNEPGESTCAPCVFNCTISIKGQINFNCMAFYTKYSEDKTYFDLCAESPMHAKFRVVHKLTGEPIE